MFVYIYTESMHIHIHNNKYKYIYNVGIETTRMLSVIRVYMSKRVYMYTNIHTSLSVFAIYTYAHGTQTYRHAYICICMPTYIPSSIYIYGFVPACVHIYIYTQRQT